MRLRFLGGCLIVVAFSGACHCTRQEAGRQEGSVRCKLEPRADAKFRVLKSGCLFGYVVDASSAERSYAGAWDPDDATLYAFERHLSETSFAVPDSFGRQYVGRRTPKGEKSVAVTFFCEQAAGFRRHQEVVISADGEPCTLRAEYYVDSQMMNLTQARAAGTNHASPRRRGSLAPKPARG